MWLLTRLYSYVVLLQVRTSDISMYLGTRISAHARVYFALEYPVRLRRRECVVGGPRLSGYAASSLLWAGRFHARRCGWVRDSSPFSLSLVAKVSRYYHQDTALRLLLGQLPPTCAGFSEPIYLYIPAPCGMHAARALFISACARR